LKKKHPGGEHDQILWELGLGADKETSIMCCSTGPGVVTRTGDKITRTNHQSWLLI